MTTLNFENALCGVADYLRDKVADRLDVNRNHIFITKIEFDTMCLGCVGVCPSSAGL